MPIVNFFNKTNIFKRGACLNMNLCADNDGIWTFLSVHKQPHTCTNFYNNNIYIFTCIFHCFLTSFGCTVHVLHHMYMYVQDTRIWTMDFTMDYCTWYFSSENHPSEPPIETAPSKNTWHFQWLERGAVGDCPQIFVVLVPIPTERFLCWWAISMLCALQIQTPAGVGFWPNLCSCQTTFPAIPRNNILKTATHSPFWGGPN